MSAKREVDWFRTGIICENVAGVDRLGFTDTADLSGKGQVTIIVDIVREQRVSTMIAT